MYFLMENEFYKNWSVNEKVSRDICKIRGA